LRKYNEFINIARNLNSQLKIVPLLYGSLGLQAITSIDFSVDDIDILVPNKYLDECWVNLMTTLKTMGYTLIDIHEHEFIKEDFKVAFAGIEDLYDFSEIDYLNLETVEVDDVKYKSLSLNDYLKVYTKSSIDSYRRTKNNDKDFDKIQKIKRILNRI
jgi:hypothetical protein